MTLLEQLQQLAPLAAAATAGPWRYGSSMELSQHEVTQTFVFQDSKVSDDDEWNNAAFIAAARNLLTPENLTALCAALAGAAALPAPYSGICALAALGGLTEEQAYDWRSNGMNGQYDDTFDAGVLHGHAELATTLLAVSAATTPKGAGHV